MDYLVGAIFTAHTAHAFTIMCPEIWATLIEIIRLKNSAVDSYSGFFDNAQLQRTDLDILKSQYIERLYIMGLATDYCVKNTVIDACQLGYKVYLIESCIK